MECDAAASAAESEGIPLVALTSREEVARGRSQVFRVRTMPKDEVNFGSTVTVKDLFDGTEEKYELVGPGEEDYDGDVMKILTNSPIAQGMIGKKVGAAVEVEIPTGTLKMEIVDISND